MLFVILGVLLVLLKLADFGAVGAWAWWLVLSPFGLAMLWWAWSDASGRTKRLEMEKMEQRKVERRRKNMAAMGLDHRAVEEKSRFTKLRQHKVEVVEGKRAAKRQADHDTVMSSIMDSKHMDSKQMDSKH